MSYAVRWEVRVNSFINIAQLTGVPINCNQGISRRLLLLSTLELIDIAGKYQGKLLTCNPPNRTGEFVYFELIFKNSADCQKFLEAMKNKSS